MLLHYVSTLHLKLKLLLALLSGTLSTLAFAPLSLYPLAWLGLAILFLLLLDNQNNKKRGFLLGWLFGIGFFGAGVSWLYVSLHFFGGANSILATFFTLIFVMFMALYTALFAFIVSLIKAIPSHWMLLLILPSLWVLIEWLRGWFLTGFPWLLVGHSHIDTWFAAIAPILGSLGVSWLVALTATLIVLFFLQTPIRKLTVLFSFSLVCLSLAIVHSVNWTEDTGESFTASLLQGNIKQEHKWQEEWHTPTLERYQAMTRTHWSSDLIIWPETAIADYFSRIHNKWLQPIIREAKQHNTHLLIGGFYYNPESRNTYNSIMSVNTHKDIETSEAFSFYHKRHLVPFSEYIPFLSYIRWMEKYINLPYDSVAHGYNSPLLPVGNYQASASVCYEDAYGNEIIDALPEADFLVNVSNDGWFSDSLEPWQHMELARMRALETGRYLLRATNTGVSAITDEKGKILASAAPYQQTTITHEIRIFKGSTPYIFWGNWAIVGLLMLIVVLTIVFTKQRS